MFFALDYPLVVQGREVRLLGVHVGKLPHGLSQESPRLIVEVELDKERPRFISSIELPVRSYDKGEFLDLISQKIAEHLGLRRAALEQRKKIDHLQQYAAHIQSILKG